MQIKRRPTIIDVARKAGVSKSSVSRVLANEGVGVAEAKRKRIQRAIKQLGYVRNELASSLRTDRTKLVMLLIPDITNPTWAETARGVQDAMDEEGYDVMFANSDWNERRELAFIAKAKQNRFDGILINPVQIDNDALLAAGIPAVILGLLKGYPQFDAVGSDNYASVNESLGHLTSLGHRRIGLIMGMRHRRSTPTRLTAYLDFMRESGNSLDDSLIVTVPFTQEGGGKGLKQLRELSDPPTAVFCDNDILAIGAFLAAREAGVQIPGELSIIGVDDIFAASITTPPLTSVSKPKYETGRQAARLLLERLRDHDLGLPRKVLLPCTLKIRGTTAEPPHR